MGGGTSFPVVSLPKERIVIVTGANSGKTFYLASFFYTTAVHYSHLAHDVK